MSNNDGQQLGRLIETFQRRNDQLRGSITALTMELAQLQSQHNRTVRDFIEFRRRLADLERVTAYRTKFSDAFDPLKTRSE